MYINLLPRVNRGFSVESSSSSQTEGSSEGYFHIWTRVPASVYRLKSEAGELPEDRFFQVVQCTRCEAKDNCAANLDVLMRNGCIRVQQSDYYNVEEKSHELLEQTWRQKLHYSAGEKAIRLVDTYNHYLDAERASRGYVPTYLYPSKNIYNNGRICWGANYPGDSSHFDLRRAYNLYWNSHFNNDLLRGDVLGNQRQFIERFRSSGDHDSYTYSFNRQVMWSSHRVIGVAVLTSSRQNSKEYQRASEFYVRPPVEQMRNSSTDQLAAYKEDDRFYLAVRHGIFRDANDEIKRGYWTQIGHYPFEISIVGKPTGPEAYLGERISWVDAKSINKATNVAIIG